MSKDNKRLQDSRKKEIPNLVAKYQGLVDGILTICAQDIPKFNDIVVKKEGKDGDQEDFMAISAEQQQFAFIEIRNKAIDNANQISVKINLLEIELHAPDLLPDADAEKKEEVVANKNPAKRNSRLG